MSPASKPEWSNRRSFWRSFYYGESPQSDPLPLCAETFDSSMVCWTMNNLPYEEAVKHFLMCGTVGSGKSTMIQLFLQSIAGRFKAGHPAAEQLIIFDAKGDLIMRLKALGLPPDDDHVYILNPFDKRASRWNLGAAIQTPAMARYLATLLVPEETSTTAPYFPNTAREILFWVATSLTKIRGEQGWSFRDLLNAVESKVHIAAVTARLPRASRVVHQHLEDERHFPGVLSTLATKLGKFEEVAALWATNQNGKEFSIPKFLSQRGVLILGHDPVFQESIWPMNAIILQALTNEVLRGRETKVPRHWFVLDEFRAMGEVRCIRDLLNLGRSKGASVLLGIQSVEGIREIYEQDATEDILSLCSTKTFLRAGGPATAEWAERHFNKVRHTERTVTETSGVTSSTSVQYQIQERSLFLPTMFLDLPSPVPGGPFKAISDIPSLRTTLITEREFDDVLAIKRDPTKAEEEQEQQGAYFRNDADEQIVQPWNPEEMGKFCDMLPPEKSAAPKTETPRLISKAEQQKRRSGWLIETSVAVQGSKHSPSTRALPQP